MTTNFDDALTTDPEDQKTQEKKKAVTKGKLSEGAKKGVKEATDNWNDSHPDSQDIGSKNYPAHGGAFSEAISDEEKEKEKEE